MPLSELLSGVISGFTAGFTVLVLEQLYLLYKEKHHKEEQLVIKATPLNKIISQQVLNRLRPGTSIENMRSMLGAPVITERCVYPLFSNQELKKFSYLYFFENADIKIISSDNEVIDSLTIMFKGQIVDGVGFALFPFQSLEKNNSNQLRLNKDFIDSVRKKEDIITRIDRSSALQVFVPNPLYAYYTAFVLGVEDESMDFLNRSIEGVCISSNEDDVYYIYEMERRIDM